MAEITAALVKELRDKSGVGMMDCKRALQETDGDIAAAIDWLRAKGLSKAAKKAPAAEAEAAPAGTEGAAAELEAKAEPKAEETPAVADDAANRIAIVALDHKDVDAVNAAPLDGATVQDLVTNLVATIGENMHVRRVSTLTASQGVVASYVHNAVATNLGKIGVLVSLESSADKAKLRELGRKIAMHIAATSPLSLNTDDLDPAAIEKEREVLTEKAKEDGRPENMIAKIVEGQIAKFQKDVVLTKQPFVMNPDQTIEQLVADTGKELGAEIKLAAFVRMGLGEGVEKPVGMDFAEEVASMTKA